MKFIIITFITLCAIATGSSDFIEDFPRVELIKYDLIPTYEQSENFGLAETINEFIKQKVDEANKFIENFNNISEEAEIEANEAIESASEDVEKFYTNINQKIIELKLRGGIYEKCGKKLESEIQKIRLDGLDNIVDCIKGVVGALKQLAGEVSREAASLSKNVVELVLLVKECYNKNGAIATAKCAFQKIKQVKELIPKIVDGIRSTVSTVVIEVGAVIEAAKNCRQNNVSIIETRFNEYNGKIMKCYDTISFALMDVSF